MITVKDLASSHANNRTAALHFVPAPKSGRGISVTIRLRPESWYATHDYRIYEDRFGDFFIRRDDDSQGHAGKTYLTDDAAALVREFRAAETRKATASPEPQPVPASSAKLPYTLDIANTLESYKEAHGTYHDLPDAQQEGKAYEDYEDAMLAAVHDLADYADTASKILARIVGTLADNSEPGVVWKFDAIVKTMADAGLIVSDLGGIRAVGN